jgi:putative oxidoreductase
MFMQKYSQQIYALLRIIAGFMFLWHGSQKLLGYPPLPPGINIPIHVLIFGGGVELIGGLLIMFGLFTHWAAFMAAGEMAYAYWTSHGTNAVLPITNHGETAVLYCFLFLFISAYGSGIWSIDGLIARRRKA